jgi:flavin-dependent dehydrogenase
MRTSDDFVDSKVSMATRRRRHAVVVGGSLAGMLAARVLADHFDGVTLLERDRFPETPAAQYCSARDLRPLFWHDICARFHAYR